MLEFKLSGGDMCRMCKHQKESCMTQIKSKTLVLYTKMIGMNFSIILYIKSMNVLVFYRDVLWGVHWSKILKYLHGLK